MFAKYLFNIYYITLIDEYVLGRFKFILRFHCSTMRNKGIWQHPHIVSGHWLATSRYSQLYCARVVRHELY